ncbi:MAG: metal ABC transporter permease [Phycisphaerae bacterium]
MIASAQQLALLESAVDALLDAAARLPFDWAREFEFMRMALVALVLVAPACGMVGVYVVHFRMAFFSDAIAHSAFAGVASGFLLLAAGQAWADPRITLVAVGLLVGVLVTAVRRHSDLSTDTIIGVAFSAVIALGIIIIRLRDTRTSDFNAYLYGDILVLDRADLAAALVLAVLVVAFMLWSYNRLLLIGLNPDLAYTRGVATRAYDYAFAIVVVLLVTTTIRITGLLLVTALLVVPAATARNLARSAGQMLWLAAAVALLAALLGLACSYYLNSATGASIILAATLLFCGSMVVRAARRS